jgi:sulfur-oxidizing protein SoxZ
MRVKAKLKNGIVKVKSMAAHDMLTYNQAETKTGNRDDANFITHITAEVNGKTVIDMSTSQFLSKNPILTFKFKGDEFKKGDKLKMSWVDLKGNTDKGSSKIR